MSTDRGGCKPAKSFCHRDRFTVDANGWTVVQEGAAQVLFPTEKDVFYNPVQEFNRDLTIAVIRQYEKRRRREASEAKERRGRGQSESGRDGAVAQERKGLRILEALAASGLRSIRFAKEIPGVESIITNDWSKQAVESIKRNVEHNKVQDIITPNNGDAGMVMYSHRQVADRFDVIDLDPYGSPTPFLDAALQSVTDGGLLCVTATDMAVLCGNTPETCYTKYGAISLKSKSCHEFAIRILLQSLESHANRYGRYIKPMLSLSIDFYCRVFVQVFSGQAKCKASTSKLGHVFQCTGCEALAFQRLGCVVPHENGKNFKYSLVTGPPVGPACSHCGNNFHMGGPIWLNPIHEPDFVAEVLESVTGEGMTEEEEFATAARIQGMLSMALEELPNVPLYYDITRLCNIVKQSQGKLTVYTSALLNSGFKFSLSHANKHGIKTDAPIDFLWDILRTLAARSGADPIKNLAADSPGRHIMSRPATSLVNLEAHPEANPESRQKQLKRFQLNPEPNWGPKMRSKTSTVREKEQTDKSHRNQNRKQSGGGDEVVGEAMEEEQATGEEGEDQQENIRKKLKCDKEGAVVQD